MKLIFYRDKSSGKLINFHKPPEKMTESEIKEAICSMNNNPNEKSTVEMVELNEYGELLFKKAEAQRSFSAECIQEALDALDNAADCIRCLRTVEERKNTA